MAYYTRTQSFSQPQTPKVARISAPPAWSSPPIARAPTRAPDGVLATRHPGRWARSGQRCRRRHREAFGITRFVALCGAHHAVHPGAHCIATGPTSIARSMRRPSWRRSTGRHSVAPSEAATRQRPAARRCPHAVAPTWACLHHGVAVPIRLDPPARPRRGGPGYHIWQSRVRYPPPRRCQVWCAPPDDSLNPPFDAPNSLHKNSRA
jgi:hypothetical protein